MTDFLKAIIKLLFIKLAKWLFIKLLHIFKKWIMKKLKKLNRNLKKKLKKKLKKCLKNNN